tara:strand:+ start:181 stop:969 length:789 start_codon:yes stop_codon:yes gene_type:complete
MSEKEEYQPWNINSTLIDSYNIENKQLNEKEKSQAKQSKILDNSLFICYSTPNYEKLTDMFLKSLHDINVKNINHKLDYPNISMKNTGFRTDLWYYCVRSKINHLLDILKNHENLKNFQYFIFTDCDIIYLKKNVNEWDILKEYIDNGDKDIYFMRERESDDVNSGFFIIKNNDNIHYIIDFFSEVLQTFDTTSKDDMPFGDQSIVNYLKDKINYGFIPKEFVIFGTQIFDINKSLIHHAVSCIDVNDKIEQINEINLIIYQ